MKQLERHENILQMVGCITSAKPVCLVMEYADNGDLLTFLLSQRQLRLPVSYLPSYDNDICTVSVWARTVLHLAVVAPCPLSTRINTERYRKIVAICYRPT